MRGQGLTMKVNVEKLLTTLATNRERHLKDYEKAKRGWKKLLAKELAQLQADLEADKSLDSNRLYLKNRKPEHYLKEYDEAIHMLSYGKADNPVIELDQEQFRAYVDDEWTWKTQWEASNTSYIAAGR